MKFLTFQQALLAVGLIGLTLSIALGAGSVPMIVVARSEFAGHPIGPSTTAATLLQAGAFALPFVVLAAAGLQRRENRANPLTFSQLLTVTGLLGLVIVATQAPHVAIWTEFVWRGNSSDYWAPLILQVVAFMVPLAVIGAGRLRALRVGRNADEGADAITFAKLVRCLALLSLASAVAVAPVAATTIVRYLEIAHGSSLSFSYSASAFVTLGAGVVVLVTVLALLFDRGDRLAGTPASARLPVIAALLGLGVVAAAHQSTTLLLGAGFILVLGLFWLNAIRGRTEGEVDGPLGSGWLLGVVALAGIALVATVTAQSVQLVAGDPRAGASIAALVLLVAGYACNLALVFVAFRRLRTEDSAETGASVEGKYIDFITFQGALRGTGVAGLSVALAFFAVTIFLLLHADEGSDGSPSIIAPVLLVVVSLAIPLVLVFARTRRGPTNPLSQGLTFTDILTATGLLGLVIVSALSPVIALVISREVAEAPGPSPIGPVVTQVLAFVVPLAILAGAQIRRRRMAKADGREHDTITGARLLICLGLLALTVAGESAVFAVNNIASAIHLGSLIPAVAANAVVLGATATTLVAALLLLMERRPGLAHRLWPAALLAFGVAATGYVYGATLLMVSLIGSAILTLCWINSPRGGEAGRGGVTAGWLLAGVAFAGLTVVVFQTQRLIVLLALDPKDDASIAAMVVLAVAYAFGLGILRRAEAEV